MAWLADYYAGRAGAEELGSRDRDALVERGEPLRFEDSSMLSDRDIARYRDLGGTLQLRQEGGGYGTISADPGVLPGGRRLISGAEALARWGDGQRPVDDPYGVLPSLQRQATNTAEMNAYKTADYLAQFLPPDRVLSETQRLTGVRLGATTTPNLQKRLESEAGREKTAAETANIDAQRREREADIRAKDAKMVQDRVDAFGTLETGVTNLNRLADAAATIRDAPALRRTVGPIAGRYVPTLTQGAADVEANLFSLKAQVGFAALTALREASKTGGGLGNVSDNDIKNLQNSIAALELTQSPENLRKSLDTVIEYTNNVRGKMERGYRSKYGKLDTDLPRPAYEQLPTAARQQLQPGKATEFGNGQVWTLHNGIPRRIK